MLGGHRIVTVAVVGLLMTTMASCTSRERTDGTSTGSAYIQTPDGHYVPNPAELAGDAAPPSNAPPEPGTPVSGRVNS